MSEGYIMMTKLILTFPALIREKVLKVCVDIAAKDKTFKYKEVFDELARAKNENENQDWSQSYATEWKPLNKIIIENPDKDVAWRRALWFKNKVDKAIYYEVKSG